MPETIKQALKAILGICIAAFSIGFVFGLAFPLRVDAAIVSSQTVDSSTATAALTTPDAYQFLNQYISGTLSGFGAYFSGGGNVRVRLLECNHGTATCAIVVQSASTAVAATKTFQVIPISYALNSAKDYAFMIEATSGTVLTYGTTNANHYVDTPSFFAGEGGTYDNNLRTVKDLYFQVFTDVSLSTEGITSIITPTYASVVPSANNAHFSFSYNSYSYTRAGFTLVDNTTGQSIITSSASSTISSSGSGTFDGYLDLVSGHVYTWTPFLSESVYNSPTIYGTPTMFFAVTNSSVYIPPAPTSPYATSSFGTIFNGIISTTTAGTTTINTGTSTNYTTGILDADLDNALRSRMPFSYIYDLLTVLSELASFTSASSSPDAEYELPFGKTANGSSTITIIDTSAVRDIEAVSQIRQLIAYTIYLMTAFAIAAAAASIL